MSLGCSGLDAARWRRDEVDTPRLVIGVSGPPARRAGGLTEMASFARTLGLEVHAGHGLTYDNVGPIAALPEVMELNIGHFLIGEAIFTGLDSAIRRMPAAMDEARREVFGEGPA